MKTLITIDIGNTNCSLALFDGNDISQMKKFSNRDLEEIENFIKEGNNSGVKDFAVSSVNTAVLGKIKDILGELKGDKYDITYQSKLNFKNRYTQPERLGADRISNLASASYLLGGNEVIVVDCGTAITVDGLNKDGTFIGGVIFPGRNLQVEALNKFTSLLPSLNPDDNFRFPGLVTEECIASGVNMDAIHGIKGIIKEMKKFLSPDAIILGTGGDRKIFKYLEGSIYIDNLIHYGIQELFNINKNN